MNLSRLRTFLAVQSTGGFSAAAERVNLGQSTVSIQMKQLEAELGAPLFVPGRRPATLTPFGLQVAERARRIVDEADSLAALAAGDDTGGRITIGFVPTTLKTLLPLVLSHLRSRFPGLSVSARSGLSDDLAASLAKGQADFAFLTGSSDLPDAIAATVIAEEPLYAIAPPGAAPARGMRELARGRPYIAFGRKTRLGRQIAAMVETSGLNLEPQIEIDSVDAIENLVAEGLGVSIVPQRIHAPALSDRLQCLRFGGEAGMRRLILATPRQASRHSIRREIAAALGAG